MGVVLCLRVTVANMDPGVDPPVTVESSNSVVQDLSTATTLSLALESHDFGTETSSTPTSTPGHGIVNLSDPVNQTT